MTPEERKEKIKALVTSRRVQIMVLIFLVALVPRVAFMDHGLWQDEGREMTVARNALQGEGFHFRHKPMSQHPFVFYLLLAGSFVLLGARDFTGIFLVNVLGALTAVVAYLIGEELYGRYTGIAAGLLLVLSPIHWFVSGRVLTDIPVTFFMALAAYLFIRSEREDSSRIFYLAAVTTGLAVLTKLTGFIVAPAFAAYALYKRGWNAFRVRRYWVGAAAALGMYLVWEIRNLFVLGHTVAVRMALFQFSGGGGGGGAQYVVGNFDPLFYATNMHSFLGLPVFALFLTGIILAYLYDDMRGSKAFPFIYLAVVFGVFTFKTYNLLRYTLPFAPLAVVVAGYGTAKLKDITTAAIDRRAGLVLYAVVIITSLALLFPSGAANIKAKSQGFTGLQQAGNFLQQNTAPDEHIIATSSNQIAWYSNRDNIHNIFFRNKTRAEQYIAEHNVTYVELDRWEQLVQKYAPYAFTYYQQSDRYQPVQAYPQNGQPSVVIYRVVNQTAN